jgi:putative sterol carrier protein
MGEIVKFPSALIDDHAFIVDMARFADGLLTEKQIKKKYRFDAATWESMGSNDTLVEAIEAEKLRRIRDGSTKRERAQVEIVDAAPILGGIMRDPGANERHRIDAVKTLDSLAATGPEKVPAGERFIITINLNSDGSDHVEHYDKSITIDANDTTPEQIPFASFKGENDGNAEPL